VRALLALAVLASILAACGGSGDEKVLASTKATALHTIDAKALPRLQVTHAASGTAPGFVFLAQKGGDHDGGPVIVDNQGRVRWYHEIEHPVESTDFRTQTYRGKPVLTWWEGTISKAGVGFGHYVVYDSSYRQIASIDAGRGLDGDLHEFQLTPRGTALVSIYDEVPADLGSVGGPKDGWAYDSVVQEIDIATKRVVFEWHSIGHVPLGESMQANREPARNASNKRPFDYFHVNSVADAPNGDILVSARNASALYLIARDGHIVWRLGGKKSDFGPPAAVKFAFQHHARLHGGNLLTLFDNGAIPKVEPFSRAVELKLDVARKKATIAKAFVHPQKLSSPFEGNFELLPDGGAFVGWGGIRRVTEFTPGGAVRFEMKLPYGDTYRGFRLPWEGHPVTKPAAAVDGNTLYASWNGSTDVASWQVLAGDDADELEKVGSAPWRGLETSIALTTDKKVVAVRALDADGDELAESAPVTR
jgi:hypothetical protein